MNIIKEYFDVDIIIDGEIPKFNISLKEDKKIRNDLPLKCITNKGIKVCQTGEKYYIHYLGGDLGRKVYLERKRLFSKFNLIKWYIENFPDTKHKNILLNHYEYLKRIDTDGLNKMYNSERGEIIKQKQSVAGFKNSKLISRRNKLLWSNPEYKKNIINKIDYSYKNHGFKIKKFYEENKDYIKKVMNNPKRIEKISKSAKAMWERWRKESPELIKKVITSGRNKNYVLNEKRMNFIEYQIGNLLNEMKLEWEFEFLFTFNKKSYIVDFYLKKSDLVIECFGDYWHANPKIFNENKNIFKGRLSKDIWKYDKIKEKVFVDNNIKFLKFWESDILENIENIKKKIYEKIK
jgi:very-short-patch-repair endonuclease